MDLPDVPLMSMLRTRMSWLHQRQDVLAQNVANADTPKYVAHDLKPLEFKDSLHGPAFNNASSLRVTNAHHIAIRPEGSTTFDDMETRDVEANPNGNSVSLEAEMIKVSDTQAQFQAAANIYAKAMTMMKTAIGH
jgi:flagellar basal-body rod protein FlgB